MGVLLNSSLTAPGCAKRLPFSIFLKAEESFETTLQTVQAEYAIWRSHQSYLQDVIHRYPELAHSSLEEALCFDLFQHSPVDLPDPDSLTTHFWILLEGLLRHPTRPICQTPLVSETERHALLNDWNATQVAYPQDKTLHQLFEEQALRTPDQVAVIYEDIQLTYRELNQQANQLVLCKPDGHKEPDYLRQTIQKNTVSVIHFSESLKCAFPKVFTRQKPNLSTSLGKALA